MNNESGKDKSKLIITIGTIVLCILFIVLLVGVLKLDVVGSVCTKTGSDSFSCGGGTTFQFKYPDNPYHTNNMTLIFVFMYSICIVEVVAFVTAIKNKKVSIAAAFLILISAMVIFVSTIFLIDDIHYGNDPHLKENQVLIEN